MRYIISFLCFPFFFERLGHWMSQTAIDRRKIPTKFSPVGGRQYEFIFLSQNCASFSTFSRRSGRQMEKCKIFWRIVVKVLEVYKKCAARTEVAAQLCLHFLDGKGIAWKQQKSLNISYTIQPIFSKFSPE